MDKLTWEEEVILRTLEITGKSKNYTGAKTAPKLSELTGISKRIVMAMLRELRLKGYKVCSGTPGYWLWDGIDDSWKHTKNHIRSRTISLIELTRAMENSPLDGQEQLELLI